MPETRDIRNAITAALNTPDPTTAILHTMAQLLTDTAGDLRDSTARNHARNLDAYPGDYVRGLEFARARTADLLADRAGQITAMAAVTTLPVQRNLRSVA